MKKFLLGFITFFTLTPLYGSSITNEELLAACKDTSLATRNFCFGFIISAANAAQFYRNIVDVEEQFIDICLPDGITNQEIVSLYTTWAQAHPELGKSAAFLGVTTSFSKKYSCLEHAPEKQGTSF